MCNCIHELLNVFEDSAQREHTIGAHKIKRSVAAEICFLQIFNSWIATKVVHQTDKLLVLQIC